MSTTRIVCSQCGTKFAARPEWAGKRVKCKQCGNVFQVPLDSGGTAGGSKAAAFREPSLLEDDRPAPPPKAPQDWSRSQSTVAIPPQQPKRSDPMASAMAAIEADATPPPIAPMRRAPAWAGPVGGSIDYASPGGTGASRREPIESGLSDWMERFFGPAIVVYAALTVVAQGVLAWKLSQADVEVPFGTLAWNVAKQVGSLLLILGPSIWLGVALASKLFKRQDAGGGYLRATGMLAMFGVAVAGVALLVGGGTPIVPSVNVAVFLVVGLIPLFFVAIRYAFRVDYFSAIFGGITGLIFAVVVGAAVMVVVNLIATSLPDAKPKQRLASSNAPPSRAAAPPKITFAPAAVPAAPVADPPATTVIPATPPTVSDVTVATPAAPVPPSEPTMPVDPVAAAKAWGALRKTVDEAAALRPTANNVAVLKAELTRVRSAAGNLADRYGRTSDDAGKVYAGILKIEDLLATAEAAAKSVTPVAGTMPPTPPTGAVPAEMSAEAPATTDDLPAPLAGAPTAIAAPPSDAEVVDAALADLQAADPAKFASALRVLTEIRPNARRNDVAAAIEPVVLERDNKLIPAATKTLKTWWGDRTAVKLLAMLDPDVEPARRHAAMEILAATRDRRAVAPITRWLAQDATAAIAALTAMGPVAEDELVKLLNDKNGGVGRLSAVKILAEVGGPKSISSLTRASKDDRNPALAAVAARALEQVRDRMRK